MQTMMNMIGNRYIILDSGLKKNVKHCWIMKFTLWTLSNVSDNQHKKYNLDPHLKFDYKWFIHISNKCFKVHTCGHSITKKFF